MFSLIILYGISQCCIMMNYWCYEYSYIVYLVLDFARCSPRVSLSSLALRRSPSLTATVAGRRKKRKLKYNYTVKCYEVALNQSEGL